MSGIAIVLAALSLVAFYYFRRAPEDTRTLRFFVSPPDEWSLGQRLPVSGALSGSLAVSPDGLRIAFIASNAEGKAFLWVRSLDTLSAQVLAGTEGASSPFWSPDGRFLGFFAGGKLKKVGISGEPPTTLWDGLDFVGGTWNRDGIIVFSSRRGELQKVSSTGGVPTAATELAEGDLYASQLFFLPAACHFLYATVQPTGTTQIYVASVDQGKRKFLLNSDSGNVVIRKVTCYFSGRRR